MQGGERHDMISRGLRGRFIFTVLVFGAAMSGLGFRLAFLQLYPHDAYRQKQVRLRSFEREISGRRGSICDRHGKGNVLALDLAVKDICVDPSEVVKSNAVREVANRLATALDLPVDEVAVKLNRPRRRYARIKRFVPADQAAEIAAMKLTGVFLRDANVRYYPQGSFMCHVLGFVNYEGVGSAGIEQAKDSLLKGRPGVVEGAVDAKRRELYLRRGKYIPGKEGNSIELTLDQNIQHIVEKELKKIMDKYEPKGAWCIVERVRTGEILAMATLPDYDLNRFGSVRSELKLNRAISYVYEPGSTMKAASFAAALNEGVVSPGTLFSCEGGAWRYKGHVLHDCHDYGTITVADGLKKSSNILTAKLALMLGRKRLYRYLRNFGIGSKTGIELPGEEAGIFHPPQKWSGLSLSRIPIGQGVAVTALQMLDVYCAIANDGYLMKPYVIKKITDSEGKTVYEGRRQVVTRVIRPEVSRTMRILLARVTEEGGTGTKAQIEGFKVAGKTGTAQKAVRGGYSHTKYMSSFVGFFPAEKPELGIIVVVDEPKKSHYGGTVAAPAFSAIGRDTARYLGIQPCKSGAAADGGGRRHRLPPAEG